ncbi:pathway-specific regulatory protein [Aspergillus keveii]|uniref:Pathway-specific regulatory protein n=1 Tax=Aspergillus keveii TaxID=714993 RepID=A0ABR4FLZ0_9EURO
MSAARHLESCLTWVQYGQKCSPLAPCRNCRRDLDSHHSVATTSHDSPDYYRDLLGDLFTLIQSRNSTRTEELVQIIRERASFQQVRAYLDQALTVSHPNDQPDGASQVLQKLQHGYEVESGAPPFRPKVMDVHYLCDFAPYKVPAQPWTTATNDDALVSHLVSLYFAWDYPFYAFIDCDIFLAHMAKGDPFSDFCSPFLVNALLAQACHYSQYSEAYTVPGDVKTKGTDFLAEAERYLENSRFQKGSVVRLASLQATIILYEMYSMAGIDDYGYMMLNQALEMAEALGIINNPNLDTKKLGFAEEMTRSLQRTAWGLFQIDTIVHANFLRPSRVTQVSLERSDRNLSDSTDIWIPYPIDRRPRPAWLSQCFDEACELSFIARDISRVLGAGAKREGNIPERKEGFYNQLRQWKANLPVTFDPNRKPAPHIIVLQMRYNALLINLYCDSFTKEPPFKSGPPHRRHTDPTELRALEAALTSAREISALVQLHREEYGVDRAHQFAMYAVMLALFAFLEQPVFNVLDHDFCSLTSTFSIMARRSHVGVKIFQIFRHSVRSRLRNDHRAGIGSGTGAISNLPAGLKELFQDDSDAIPAHREGYAENPGKLTDEEAGVSGDEYTASGIGDMLAMYEKLSVGKEADFEGRQRSADGFRFSPSPPR